MVEHLIRGVPSPPNVSSPHDVPRGVVEGRQQRHHGGVRQERSFEVSAVPHKDRGKVQPTDVPRRNVKGKAGRGHEQTLTVPKVVDDREVGKEDVVAQTTNDGREEEGVVEWSQVWCTCGGVKQAEKGEEKVEAFGGGKGGVVEGWGGVEHVWGWGVLVVGLDAKGGGCRRCSGGLALGWRC